MSSNPNFLLTPQQQELLFAALNANRPSTTPGSLTVSPTAMDNTSAVATTKPADLSHSIADSSFLDYDYAFDADTSLDFSANDADQSNYLDGYDNDDSKTDSANGSTAGNDSPDKRSHPDDGDDDATAAKRREGTEKVPKKPGRKPLTSEPSSKRKAQNRAAQRAFRERKEKHLKDLETKVAELEKASETANSENSALRAQVEKMTVELSEYKKRMELMAKARPGPAHSGRQLFGNPIFHNINDVNFQFEFPKFGQLPGPSTAALPASGPALPASAATGSADKRTSSLDTFSSPPTDLPGLSTASSSSGSSPTESNTGAGRTRSPPSKEDLAMLSSVLTPPLTKGNVAQTARTSMDLASTSSPSASSHSNTAPSSSCGTSPEPFTQSPMGFKAVDALTTIGEEQPAMFANTSTPSTTDYAQFANVDINDMSWMGSQTNFRFDPQLFGDYREPQESILAGGGLDDSFFNDALDVDFTTPFNTALSPIVQPKGNLLDRIDAAKEAEFPSSSLAHKPAPSKTVQLLTCNTIWERLQTCPKVQNGDFDLDGLCSDLQKKAKCSGSGAVVDEKDFKMVMTKYLGKDGDASCAEGLLADARRATA